MIRVDGLHSFFSSEIRRNKWSCKQKSLMEKIQGPESHVTSGMEWVGVSDGFSHPTLYE